MNIQAVNFNIINTYFINRNRREASISFKSHPDFIQLSKTHNITASSFFRRGQFYGSACEEFQDIVSLFKKIFGGNLSKECKMLIAGIGNSQEPFSYLAVIKDIIKNKKIKKVLDLNIVDLQSEPLRRKLFEDSFFEFSHIPNYAADSFVIDQKCSINYSQLRYYRVNDEIFDYLCSVYHNQKKSQWDTRVQEAVKLYQPDEFDVISINNTLGYIKDRKERTDAFINIERILKQDGILITDPNYKDFVDVDLSGSFAELGWGIFKKDSVVGGKTTTCI